MKKQQVLKAELDGEKNKRDTLGANQVQAAAVHEYRCTRCSSAWQRAAGACAWHA